MSTTTHPHPTSHSVSPNRFNILRKTHSIPSFVVEIHLLLLLFSFPFSSQLFNFLSISFTSLQNSLQPTTKLIFLLLPLSSLYIIPPLFPPLYSLLLAQKPASLLFFYLHFPLQLFSHSWRLRVPPPDLVASSLFLCPLWSLCRPSFSGSVWCVSLWSFCATVHPVDRKHPVHHHSQLPVGSAGSVWPICVIFCQITGVWLCMIHPSPNHLPGEKGREAGVKKGAGWSSALNSSALTALS